MLSTKDIFVGHQSPDVHSGNSTFDCIYFRLCKDMVPAGCKELHLLGERNTISSFWVVGGSIKRTKRGCGGDHGVANTKLHCYSRSSPSVGQLHLKNTFLPSFYIHSLATVGKFRIKGAWSEPSAQIIPGYFNAGVECGPTLPFALSYSSPALLHRIIHFLREPMNVADSLPSLICCFRTAALHLIEGSTHNRELATVYAQSNDSNDCQSRVNSESKEFNNPYFAHQTLKGAALIGIGFIFGVLGNVLLWYGRRNWRIIALGFVCWLIAVIFTVHGAELSVAYHFSSEVLL